MLISPLGGLHGGLEDVNFISFNANSWVDLLVGSLIFHLLGTECNAKVELGDRDQTYCFLRE